MMMAEKETPLNARNARANLKPSDKVRVQLRYLVALLS
jgi:hypothetical protein